MVITSDILQNAYRADLIRLLEFIDAAKQRDTPYSLSSIQRKGHFPLPLEDRRIMSSHCRQASGNFLHCVLLMAPHRRGDRSDAVRSLLSRGIHVNVKNEDGLTPLHLCGFTPEMSALIDGGADANARDSNGVQPLHIVSCLENSLELTKLLVHRGADVFAKSYHGIRGTAEEFNTRLRNFETAKFLADKAASGWSPYDRVPRIELVRLRSLCIRGRASPPPEPILERLFGAPAAPTKNKTAVTPLPREVFWHVLSFWRASQ